MLRKTLLRDASERALRLRREGVALNAKEFSVVAGISYGKARQWFHREGFPCFDGYVFWEDFELWRRRHLGLQEPPPAPAPAMGAKTVPEPQHQVRRTRLWTGRAAQILREFD